MKSVLIVLAALLGAAALVVVGAALWFRVPDRSRAELDPLYFAPADQMIRVAGTDIHLRDTGPKDAPAVILIHGFGSSLHTWEDWAKGLEDSHRVIRYDLPGAGLSPPDTTGDYSDARAVAIVLGLMDQLGLAKTDLVGNSIGGRIAWRFAAAYPERVERLVLVSPDGFASPGFAYGVAPKVPLMMEAMRYVLPEGMFRANLEAAFADPSVVSERLFRRYYDLMLAPGARGALLARMRQTVLEPPAPYLAHITAPVLLLWGKEDALIPVANAADYLAVLADARLVTLDDIGHVPQEEAPAKSLVPVREFLAR